MNTEQLERLWDSCLAGESLPAAHEAELVRALIEQPQWRRAMLDQQACDTLLWSLGQPKEADDQFVAEFRRRAADVLPVPSGLVGGASAAQDVSLGEVTLAEAELLAPPVCEPCTPGPPAPRSWIEPEPLRELAQLTARELVPEQELAAVRNNGGQRTALRKWSATAWSWAIAGALAGCVALGIGIADLLSERNAVHRPAELRPAAIARSDTSPEKRGPASVAPPTQIPPERLEKEPAVPSALVHAIENSARPSRNVAAPIVNAVWRSGGPVRGELPTGLHELADGDATITIDSDRVQLLGPAVLEVNSDHSLSLRKGSLRALEWPAGNRWRISTPTSKVVDSRGAWDLNVADSGATDLTVRSGEATLDHWTAGDGPGLAAHLTPYGFNRAVVSTCADAPAAPVTCRLTGPGGRFLGRVAVEGQSLDFASPDTFATFQKQATERFVQDRVRFLRDWTALVNSLGLPNSAAGPGQALGSVDIHGQRVEAKTVDQFFQAIEPQRIPSPVPAGQATHGESFEGVITINGKEVRYHSREEFDAARQQLLTPWNNWQSGGR